MAESGSTLSRYGLRWRRLAESPGLLNRLRMTARALGVLIATTFRADPMAASGATALEILGGFASVASALWLKVLADAVARREAKLVLVSALGMAGMQAVNWLGQAFGTRMRVTLIERVGFAFDRRIAQLTSGLVGLEHTERPDYQDKLILLREAQGTLGLGANALVNLASATLRGVTAVALLAAVYRPLLLLPVFAIPQLVAQAAAQRWAKRGDDESAPHRRRALHLYGLALHEPGGREARIFGLEAEIGDRLANAWRSGSRPLIRARVRAAEIQSLASAVFAIAFITAVSVVVHRAARGEATAGDALLTMALAGQLSAYLATVVSTVANLQRMVRETTRLVWLADYERQESARYAGVGLAPSALEHGIVFEGVSFRYPGTEQWVLRDIHLDLACGTVVALVGENGAGKTTLVKLLCRFYDPTEGQILVDGADLRELDVKHWRQQITAEFQDFVRLELEVIASVGVGDIEHMGDEVRVRGALGRAGAASLADDLPRGLATQLGARWDGGVDLSGGQWQKVALARTLMREAPAVLILDEPTASLDARTEHELFESLTAASRDQPNSRLTVIVSHRFSTVRMADHIVVIAGTSVVEQGSHADLMARGGFYADLYNLQARGYE
jgi:ATP-binding cassette, subfamily B, bacterial